MVSPFLSKSLPPGAQEKGWGQVCPPPWVLKGPQSGGFYRVKTFDKPGVLPMIMITTMDKPGMIPLPIPFETRLGLPLTLGRRPPLLPRPIILIETVWSSALWFSCHTIYLGRERVL